MGTHVLVKWINDLEVGGHFVSYPTGVPVNTDINWANPPQLCDNGQVTTDCKGSGGNYFGPVPLVVHAHGEISKSESDGIPQAWNLPAASTAGYSTATYFPHGSDYCQVDLTGAMRTCAYNNDGAALFEYPNQQAATTLFFHDHAFGVTTQNVYMGLVGFYLLRGGSNDLSYNVPSLPSTDPVCAQASCVTQGGLPHGDCSPTGIQAGKCYDIALAITDKAFNTDGSLKFREEGNIILVNGKSWPFLNVEPRKYRFHVVIAAPTSRFDLLFPDTSSVTLKQIGADQGFLPHPTKALKKLTLMPGERADVVVDFSSLSSCAGQSTCTVNLLNDNGGRDTGQLIQFRVGTIRGTDTSAVPTTLPGPVLPVQPMATTLQVSLFDNHLGTCSGTGCATASPKGFDDAITELPQISTNQVWEMYDFEDSHPMHLHEVQFQVINREKISCVISGIPCPVLPGPGETGLKDTVQANGGQVTRVLVSFGSNPGLFAWHCHINPHEDDEMMRPMCVTDPTLPAPVPGADGIVGNSNPSCPSRP